MGGNLVSQIINVMSTQVKKSDFLTLRFELSKRSV